MCSLCRLPVAENHNFGQFLTFGGLLYRLPFTDEGQIWCAKAEPRSTLTRRGKIHLNISLCRLLVTKNDNFGIGLHWTRTSTGQRSFGVDGPRTWDRLPPALRLPELSLSSFKRQLKCSAVCSCVSYIPASGTVATVVSSAPIINVQT